MLKDEEIQFLKKKKNLSLVLLLINIQKYHHFSLQKTDFLWSDENIILRKLKKKNFLLFLSFLLFVFLIKM